MAKFNFITVSLSFYLKMSNIGKLQTGNVAPKPRSVSSKIHQQWPLETKTEDKGGFKMPQVL
jgi:hypothetical protein